MGRSIWKGIYVDNSIFDYSNTGEDVSQITLSNQNNLRNTTIVNKFVGQQFNIYNGKKFFLRTITDDMLGHKFGEFSMTCRVGAITKEKNKGKRRSRSNFGKKKKKRKKKFKR